MNTGNGLLDMPLPPQERREREVVGLCPSCGEVVFDDEPHEDGFAVWHTACADFECHRPTMMWNYIEDMAVSEFLDWLKGQGLADLANDFIEEERAREFREWVLS